MIDRRDALRLALLALGATALTSCSGGGGGRPAPRTADAIELVSSDVRRAAGDPTLVAPVVAGLDGLAAGLYDDLRATGANVVLSPYSVLVALGMTLAGAAGTTATEMRQVVGAGALGERWHKGVNALTATIDGLAGKQERGDGSKAELALATANQLFGQRGVAWEADFVDLLGKEYGAALRGVDFEGATERARTAINDWVEQQTADRIVDLVPAGALDPRTRLVLVNAIYLKAPWEEPFEKGLTEQGEFHRADGSPVTADLMRNPSASGTLRTGPGWRALTLPYAGRRTAMTIVLPDPGRFAAVEQEAARHGFAAFTAGGTRTAIDLTLPRWTFRTAASLVASLQALGMRAAFTDAADFTPMTEEELPLTVSDVLHQAFVAVDEEGTEAAAATAVVMEATAVPITEEFRVDRPFLFTIHDTEHGTPLFVGRVTDPTSTT
ncbi:serpin family protein [Nocardioides sp. LML1-1-1.1]|uniref:serpin family protein n=1 Tax=Nocardioides sp. LML1-1-1.1 TaxID=3135248 RepID=UPI00342496B1